MILQAVPTEDSDDDSPESAPDASLYGRAAGAEEAGSAAQPGRKSKSAGKRAAAALKAKVHQRVAKTHEYDQRLCGWAFAGVCCCLSVVGVGTALALLQRYGEEASVAVAADGPVLAVFSYAPNTDAALAWLAAALLSGESINVTSDAGTAGTVFSPLRPRERQAFLPDGQIVGVWDPEDLPSRNLRALAHGGVAGMLRRVHGFGPPRVRDVAKVATEADAFLSMRALLAEMRDQQDGSQKSGQHRRMLREKRTELVLVSHPHHMPYLAALARAAGFRPMGLEPAVYGGVPWADFGCGPLGYPTGASPAEGVQKERRRLEDYAESLKSNDEAQYVQLQDLIRAANATLGFHQCMAERLAGGTAASKPGAAAGSSSAVSGVIQLCSDSLSITP